ncbi:MAG: hypothetical protein KIT00_02555 [Rhodospirillales bacterium]|nr:hypothetical protein [Rhodospirillales bacterium]
MRFVIPFLAIAVLSGCTEYFAVEIASLAVTDKTLGDHVVSVVSGKDCSLVRSESGLSYCVEDEVKIAPAVHCYRTLGEVDCYRQRHPESDRYREVGLNDHNHPSMN